MDFPQLDVTVRTSTGKGPARRLRLKGRAPGVLYGSGVDTISISVTPADLIKALSGPLHTNTVLSLNISGKTASGISECKVMVKDHQFDPVSRELLHVDFVAVQMEKKMQVKVPFRVIGRSIGEQVGGKLVIVHRTLLMECLPDSIPVEIVADITELDLNQSFSIKDLEFPESAEILLPSDTTVVLIQTAKAEEVEAEEEEGEEGEGEGEATAEGAEGDAKADEKSEEKSS